MEDNRRPIISVVYRNSIGVEVKMVIIAYQGRVVRGRHDNGLFVFLVTLLPANIQRKHERRVFCSNHPNSQAFPQTPFELSCFDIADVEFGGLISW